MQIDTEAMQFLYECAAQVDSHYIHELVGEYVADALRMFDEIEAAFQNGDAATVHRLAHTLKSQSATYGAMEFSETCLAVEMMTKGGSLDGAADMIKKMRAQYADVQAALRDELARNR